jgi:multiple sugar transport system ATP-binding protein
VAGLTLSTISKSFGATQVLNDVSLDIRDGEFLTLVGPSGCGKSTLLRIIAGLEAPSEGTVRIDGRDVTSIRPAQRNLAMVFQSYALYPHLTVAENMLTPLKLRDLSAIQRFPVLGPLFARGQYLDLKDQVSETAKTLQIEALLDRKPGQLSGGQRQRAALGRAMVRKPVAFLMDEPLSNLDAALRVHMRSELAELHRALGVTFIYVTHDQAEALTMSDRMAVMMDGDILQLDAPRQVYNDPSDIRVAEFVGSPKINLLPGQVDPRGRVTFTGGTLNRKLKTSAGEVQIGVRPEHLRIARGRSRPMFEGVLRHLEHLGSDIFLHLAVEDGKHRCVVRTTPAEASHMSIGVAVGVSREDGAVMVFHRNGSRLRFEPPQSTKRGDAQAPDEQPDDSASGQSVQDRRAVA